MTRLGAPLGLSFIGPAGSDLSLVRLAANWSNWANGANSARQPA
jgi:Asp-tRNA(Asn)/Glu-tRNA(Gln) amidotransferase A subunit family amidase